MKNSILLNDRDNNTLSEVIRRGRKLLTLVVFMLLFSWGAKANSVDAERARRVATTFLNNNGARSIELADVTSVVGFSNVYVFTTETSFVLMSADDCVQPILGYSLTGRFDFENMPDNKRAWIQGYSNEIRYAVDNQLRASSEVTQQWRDLVEGNPNAGRAITAVAPLIQTQWDQGDPYNLLCPGGSVTGCVATAMAQIMKYWNYPEHGIGSHSYSHPTYGELSADFQSTIYDWNNMINSYYGSSTYAQKMAVATLMYHCGVSVNMNYSPTASGAGNTIVAEALKNYFNYSSDVVFRVRSEYTDNDWIVMLKNDLNLSRPIWYCGSGSGGGHAFVFDGYNSNNYFHVNWGWGGYCDEYYVVNNLNPGPGGIGSGNNGIYNDNQGAVFGIRPSECTANAPVNLTYSQNGRNVTLSWSAATGASSYLVYRNNSFVGEVSSTSYSDIAPYGSSVYYVRSVDFQGRLSLSSNAVTVTVAYPIPVVDDLAATVSGNNVNLAWTAPDWCYPATPTATMTYGNGNYTGIMGYNNGSTCIYWGHRYPASSLSGYNNMKVYKVSFYANEMGSYQVFVYKGTSYDLPQTQLLQQSFSVGSTGWYDIDLSTPIQIDASNDLWVFIYDPEARSFPATYCSYSGSEGNYYSTDPNSWLYTWDNAAFLIRTFVTDGTYTYNVYRNGSNIASNLNNTSFSDNNLSGGVYNYYVKTNYYAGETEASNQVTVQIGSGTYYTISASANPPEGGSVTGAGSYLQGNSCTLTATANTGYTFVNWTQNGDEISTNATLSFTVTENATFVANFNANTPPSQELEVFAEYYPNSNDPNSQYVKVSWSEGSTGDNFFVDFENGLPAGWTIIDANNDGLTWTMTSDIPTTWTYYANMTLDWYHNGSNAICSGSYINGYGAVTPDEYLVSPQVNLGVGSSISFWVAATDPNYPADHFGVFVSENGTSNWTSVQEWTLTGTKSGLMGGVTSRNGQGLRLGTWYNFTVDLSAYAGSNRYIAFRHFNCNDQYIMCIDDITLSSSKSARSMYRVYRAHCDGSEEEMIANNVTGNQYIDYGWSGLAPGNYRYGVSVINERGDAGEIHWNDAPITINHHKLDVSAFLNRVPSNNHISEPSHVNSRDGWLYYDDGNYVTNVGADGVIYWGTMFPASMLTENKLTKVALYENGNNNGTIILNVYSGGNTAPGTLIYSQNITPVVNHDFHEITFSDPVTINPNQNLWITFYQNGDSYPASACNDSGDANNRWVSLDGSSWFDLADAGLPGYGWMIRCYVEDSGGSGSTEISWSNCIEKPNSTITQTSTFSEGYNWWSTYIEQEGIDGLGLLQEGLGNNGVSIRSQASGYTDYYQGYGWYGSLSSINNESSYRVITSVPCTVTMTGNKAIPSEHPITLSQGWTWIGYVPTATMDVNVAMSGLTSTSGDKLKSQQGYADYYSGYGWFGSLNTIEPGMGLMYYSMNGNLVTFTYPNNDRGGELKKNFTAENNHWEPNPHAYPTNMTLLAVIDVDDEEIQSEDYELAVFDANGECRGSIKTMYVDITGRYYAFMTIYGDSPVELHFGLYDWEAHTEFFDVDETVMFNADASIGTIFEPMVLHFHGLNNVDEFDKQIKVFPNPVNCGEQFSLGMAEDMTNPVCVEIINTMGVVEKMCISSHQTLIAPNVAGVYMLRITVEGKGTFIHKLIVK